MAPTEAFAWQTGAASLPDRPARRVAMGLFDTLFRALSNRAEAPAVDEAQRLELEVVQLYEEGLLHDAETSARRLVELRRANAGEDHPAFATALSNLALLLQRQGDAEGAEPLLRQALEVRRAALGAEHPDYASSLNNLALLLCERRDLDTAEPLLRESLEIRRNALGEHHADYATGLSSLALLLCARHDLDGAEPLLRQAMEIRRSDLGEHHADYATSLNNLALLLCERSDFEAAESLFRQALAVRRDVLGEQHPDTVSTAEALAALPARPETWERAASQRGRPASAPAVPDRHQPQIAVPPAPLFPPLEFPERPVACGPPRDPKVMAADLAALRGAFVEASESLLQQAAAMQAQGLPPELPVLSATAACHRQFVALRAEALDAAARLGIPTPPAEEVASLDDLGCLVERLAQAGLEASKNEATRRHALERLARVLTLTCRDAIDAPHLAECQSQARILHEAIATCPAAELPPEAEPLAAGDHPLASLLALVHDEADETGERWAEHYQEALRAFGKPLAVAAARGRIATQDETPAPTGDLALPQTEGEARPDSDTARDPETAPTS